MQRISIPAPSRRVIVAVGCLLGLLAAVLVLVATSRFGLGVSPDSAAYLSVAGSLAAGDGLRAFDGLPLTTWPPL